MESIVLVQIAKQVQLILLMIIMVLYINFGNIDELSL